MSRSRSYRVPQDHGMTALEWAARGGFSEVFDVIEGLSHDSTHIIRGDMTSISGAMNV